MSRKTWEGLLASAFIGVLATAIVGCSSSSNTTPNAVADAAPDVGRPTHHDAGSATFDASGGGSSGGGIDSGTAPAFDGTSGKACNSNADCSGSTVDGGQAAGINVCSNTYSGKLGTLNGLMSPQLWPTPLCMMPLPTMSGLGNGNCDPGDQNVIQFCDSADPNDEGSAGVCLPLTTPAVAGAGNGVCFPHCTFKADGSPPGAPLNGFACPGKDTCSPLPWVLDPNTNSLVGHGSCQGTCQADSDCSALGAGWVCQTDLGLCTKTKKVRTKAIGAACSNSSSATSDSETGACNCPFGGATTTPAFYCSSACVVGGTPCPSGYVCDALLSAGQVTFTGAGLDGGDVTLQAPTVQNPGLSGLCLAPCTPDGGVVGGGTGDAGAGDGGSAQCPGVANVPPLSTCTAQTDSFGTVAGPDCLPPSQ